MNRIHNRYGRTQFSVTAPNAKWQSALLAVVLALSTPTWGRAEDAAPVTTIPVDSPAFVFSPGNWTGDEGRGGKRFRQTWNSGAYFRVTWETDNPKPTAKLLVDRAGCNQSIKPPQISYCIDGVWKSSIPCAGDVVVEDISGAGKHELAIFLQWSEQKERWGSEGQSGSNVLRVTGLQVDTGSKPLAAAPQKKWALIIGDSITEGVGTTALAVYSHLVGEALRTQGYEYCVSACGWSGWIHRGDDPPGDVPGYYVVTNCQNGVGEYDDAASRWNKIDGNGHSLLDAGGHLSAYGQAGQEPSLILINYGTNDALNKKANPGDTLASISQSLAALRKGAPDAQIILLIPFGQYCAKELMAAVQAHKKANPGERRLAVIDLGPGVARSLTSKARVMGDLHPNDRGHANFAAQIIPQVMNALAGR